MARQTSFGEMLRTGRERKGLDLSTAARRLRIRPDILRAIEEGDFARMPPRGYTSNMVGAYARLVGLNPTELTRLYRDEAQQFETGRRPMDSRGERSRSVAGAGGRPSRRGEGPGRSSRSGSSRSSRSGRPAPQPQYTNLVQGRQAPGITANFGSMLPILAVGAIIVILLVIVLLLAFGGDKGSSADDTPTVPISGMPSPAGTSNSEGGSQNADAPTVEPVAPTNAKFTYKVADGKEAYLEVIVDGKTMEAKDVSGPAEKEYPVTGTLKFVTSSPENVTIAVDGEEVKPEESSSARGVYTYTVDFEQVLRDWQKANGVKSTGSNDSSQDGDSSSGDSQDGGSSSGDSSGSDGDSTSSGSGGSSD